MTAAIEIKGLQKYYQGKRVLDIASLSIEAGKIHAVIGPNGAGKSTLLRLLNLLEEPTKGSFSIFGQGRSQMLNNRLHWQRKMAMVMQKPSLFNQSVARNVAYGLDVRGVKRAEKKKLVAETLSWVGMSGYEKQNARTLSGGEAQRVALARAIVFRPELLFLDEPTASLDPASVTAIENLVGKINRELGATVVMVTHNLFQARRLADNIIVLMEGKVIETGAAEEIFRQQPDSRTGAFLAGEMIY